MNKFYNHFRLLSLITCVVTVFLAVGGLDASAGELRRAWNELDAAAQREFPTNDPNNLEIWLYSDRMSYIPGDEIIFYVHTTADEFDISIERDGGALRKVFSKAGIRGRIQKTPKDAYAAGAKWEESLRLKIPPHLSSGVYLVTATAAKDGREKRAEHFFVVRPAEPGQSSKAVLMLATATYAAYNDWGGANAFRMIDDGAAKDRVQARLSLRRPWAKGFVKLPLGAPRHGQAARPEAGAPPRYPFLEWSLSQGYSRHYADAGWAFYERPFAVWAEKEGYKLEYMTQHDLHNDPGMLVNYQLLIIVGHDQFWSMEMRDAVDAFLAQGGKVARFGGGFLWQIRLEDGGDTQICHMSAEADPVSQSETPHKTTTVWEHPLVNRPGAQTFGLSGLGGGYIRLGGAAARASGGFTVYRPEHWAFREADLYYGDLIGSQAGIAAYQVDGLPYTFKDGLPQPVQDQAPLGVEILALAPAVKAEEDHSQGMLPLMAGMEVFRSLTGGLEVQMDTQIPGGARGLLTPRGAAMIAVYKKGPGEVFNAGSSMWVNGLMRGDFYTQRITKNVLDEYLGNAQ